MTQAQPAQNTLAAALWMSGAIVSFSLMAIAGREAGLQLDTFEMMTYRSIVGLVLVLSIGGLAGTLSQIKTDRIGTHVARNLAHFTGQNLWFWALGLIPMAQLFALEFTSPLWVMALAAVFLGERLTKIKLFAGAVGFVGVLIVVQPGSAPISMGMVAAGTAAIFFAITAILTKRLTGDQSITCILFWLTAIQLVFGLIMSLYDGQMTVPTGAPLAWVIGIGFAGLSAHLCLTKALSVAPASVVMPMDFLRLPVIALLSAYFYEEPLVIAIFIGGALIFGANYINILSARRSARAN